MRGPETTHDALSLRVHPTPECVMRAEENEMTMHPKPGNQPDPNDMAAGLSADGEGDSPPAVHPTPAEEQAEEEAARLGDFA